MARISTFMLLFVLPLVLGIASAKTRQNAADDIARMTSDLGRGSQLEMGMRSVAGYVRELIHDILENIILAIDCYLNTPDENTKQEQYKKVAEEIKKQLLKSMK